LLRLAWLLTADRHDAQDLVQDALARVLPRWGRIAPEAREAYVRTVIRSQYVDRLRRERHLQVAPYADLPEDHFTSTGLDRVGQVDAQLSIAQALARLGPRQRAVLVLRFYEDLSQAQTADVLGVRVATVNSQTRRALERLRDLAPDLADAFGRGAGAPSPSRGSEQRDPARPLTGNDHEHEQKEVIQ